MRDRQYARANSEGRYFRMLREFFTVRVMAPKLPVLTTDDSALD